MYKGNRNKQTIAEPTFKVREEGNEENLTEVMSRKQQPFQNWVTLKGWKGKSIEAIRLPRAAAKEGV
jgi:hypothetical protein